MAKKRQSRRVALNLSINKSLKTAMQIESIREGRQLSEITESLFRAFLRKKGVVINGPAKTAKTVLLALLLVCPRAAGDEPKPKTEPRRPHPHNYILERQEAYLVRGVPVQRMIIGKREIDI
jgi:hypothetical protein